jgi:hypothetical protein
MAATRAKLKETDTQLSALKEAVKEMPDQAGTGNVKKTISDLEKLFHHFKF